ncbi:MAG: hypothetical protein ACFFCI_17785 [Promethearchaeota archaeon]
MLEIINSIISNTSEIGTRASTFLEEIIDDFVNILGYFKNGDFIFSEEEKLIYRGRLQTHRKKLVEVIEELSLVKKCSKCNKEFPASSKFFYQDKNAKYHLRSECKECHKRIQKELYHLRRNSH